ncbi:hypothetical protein [Delftia tsuruhatensis]|nr:hypothetical protein [Delftia tsuruhatensis]
MKPLLAVAFVGGLMLAAYAYGEGHNKTAVASMAIALASVLRIKPMN